jgi:hypothetical protein
MKRILAASLALASALLVYIYASRNELGERSSGQQLTTDVAPKTPTAEPSQPVTKPSNAPALDADNTRPNDRLAVADSRSQDLAAAPLRGVLVDSKTHQPIPEFVIEVKAGRRKESVITNRDGTFATQESFETGDIHLRLVDRPVRGAVSVLDEPVVLEHKHAAVRGEPGPDPVFEATVGPTYRVGVELPAGTSEDDFFATFAGPSTHASQSMHAAIAEDPNSVLAQYVRAAGDPNELEQRASLRVGEPRWVRFRAPIVDLGALLDDPSRHELQIRSHDGHWAGAALVNSLEGVYPQTLSIELTGRGTIDGVVVSEPDGQPVPSAWIQLSNTRDLGHSVAELGADARGRFSFQWLPADEYGLRIQSKRFRDWTTRVTLVAGETRKIEARLTSPVQLGTISGVLRSRTGRHRSKGAMVRLRGVDDPSFYLFKDTEYRKLDGQYVAPFSFEKVPAGDYRLSIGPFDNRRWNTRTMTVSVPAEAVEFICEDDSATFDLAFQAVDAETAERLSETWTTVWQGDPSQDIRLDRDFESGHYLGVPEDTPIRWMVRAAGYRLAWGDATQLEIDGNLRTARARLVRGWGQLFLVTTPNRDPIAGVELLVDGKQVGTTDSRGLVIIDLDRKPDRLEFVREGLSVSWGTVDPADSKFGWGPETPVYLSPSR